MADIFAQQALLPDGWNSNVRIAFTDGRITNVQPGQYALFPHFRADGWLYFVVRTLDTEEWFVASDAALADEPGSASPLPLPL